MSADSHIAEGRLDYLAIGHVTVDVLPDGSRRAGGSALYAALQAARLGGRAMILTRGARQEVEQLLEPYLDELALVVQPAAATTTLQTDWSAGQRRQRLLAWAGPIERQPLPSTRVLHLAPVAAELDWTPSSPESFVGLTPQGLLRRWAGPGAEVRLDVPPPAAVALARGCDAIVLSAEEQTACAAMLAEASAAGALVAVTAGTAPTELLLPDGQTLQAPVQGLANPVDDLGAGDVYASALFLALADGQPVGAAAERASAAARLRVQGSGPGAVARAAQLEG